MLEQLAYEGYLAPIARHQADFFRDIITAEKRDLTIIEEHMVSHIFINSHGFVFNMAELNAGEVHFVNGQIVQAGEILIEFAPEETERYEIRLRAAIQNLERQQQNFTTARDRQLDEIEYLREVFQLATDENWQLKYLQLARHETELQLMQQRHQQNQTAIQREIDEINSTLAENRFYAQIDGRIVWHQHLGWEFANETFISLIDETSLFFSLSQWHWDGFTPRHPPEIEQRNLARVRYGDILPVLIRVIGGGDYNLYMRVVSDPWVTGERLIFSYPFPPVNRHFLLAPMDWDEFNAIIHQYAESIFDMHLTIIARTEIPIHNALTLPTDAIRTLGGRAYVEIYENGYRRRQYITTGVIHGRYAQILTGITEGQQVLIR